MWTQPHRGARNDRAERVALHDTATDPLNLSWIMPAEGGSGMTTSLTRAIILAGGELHTTPIIGPDDLVVAVDSGYDHAVALGVRVDVLVGDLDSISTAGLAHARAGGVDVEEYPRDKDATDLELALELAIDRGASTIDIHGGEAGRIDHLLGVALSISHVRWDSIDIAWHTRTGDIRSITSSKPLAAPVSRGDVVSLIPVGTASGVTTTGLRWPLSGTDLVRGSSRGISNEATSEMITVAVESGALLFIQNEAASP